MAGRRRRDERRGAAPSLHHCKHAARAWYAPGAILSPFCSGGHSLLTRLLDTGVSGLRLVTNLSSFVIDRIKVRKGCNLMMLRPLLAGYMTV